MPFRYSNIETYLSAIDYQVDSLEKLEQDAPEFIRSEIITTIQELRTEMHSFIYETYRDFGRLMTRAHIEVLRILSSLRESGGNDDLLRRSYVISYFGMICSELLAKPDFRRMNPFFPSIQ